MSNHPVNVHVHTCRPGIFERGLNRLGAALGSAADGVCEHLDQYTPEGAQRRADTMSNRDMKAMLGMHGAFWSVLPLAAGILSDTPWLAGLGAVAMGGGIAYSIYQAMKS